jgi:Outer membrane lipoprotein-sorting protein
MKTNTLIQIGLVAIVSLTVLTAGASTAAPSAQEVVAKVLDADPFGLAGAGVTAHLLLKDKTGATSTLAFTGRSTRYDPPFSKSIVRFTAPPDLAGAGFLQVQKRTGDDDRFLFLPELKRSRRISGSLRSSSFMGTDFAFADLDRRDFREAELTSKPDDEVGKYVCFRVDVAPKRSDSPYAKLEAWIRKDNFLPLKLQQYDHTGVLIKTFTAQEVRRIDGSWFITKSRMLDHAHAHTTDLLIDAVAPLKTVPDDEFTVRNLEKM